MIHDCLSQVYHAKRGCYLNHPDVLKEVQVSEGDAVHCIFFEPPGSRVIDQLTRNIETVLFELPWVQAVTIGIHVLTGGPSQARETPLGRGLDHVTNILAVSSCKGGVGKSTMALHLASALHLAGAQVGIFDADIHGPSLPTLITPRQMADTMDETTLPPFLTNTIKLMSYGYIQHHANQPAILRGPMASNVLKQLIFNTDWGHLDYLILDCPPGTGDILLTITQEIQLAGALVVTSPHALAYADVQKGIEMFRKVNVPILGLIENMSHFICDECSKAHYVYGRSRLPVFSREHGIPFWYDIPIDKQLANATNTDLPFLLTCSPDHPLREIMARMTNDIAWQLILDPPTSTLTMTHCNDNQTVSVCVDDETTVIPYNALRAMCSCAHCVNELTGERQWHSDDFDEDTTIDSLFLVGHYGQGVVWSEHGTTHSSMYTHDALIQQIQSMALAGQSSEITQS